jgi:ribosomal protein L14
MESELKYYSSLTVGSTIVIDYKGGTHELQVLRVKDGDQQLDGANIQDVNVAVDFEDAKPKKMHKASPAAAAAATAAAASAAAAAAAAAAAVVQTAQKGEPSPEEEMDQEGGEE